VVTELFESISTFSKNNIVLAGAFGVYFAGITTFLLREVPGKLYLFIKSQITISLIIENEGWYNDEIYNNFLNYIRPRLHYRYSRSITIQALPDNKTLIGPAYGTHIFFFNKKVYWFTIDKVESSGTNKQKKSITVKTFGRNNKCLIDLANHFKYESVDKTDRFVFVHGKEGWEDGRKPIKRSLESVMVPVEIKNTITNALDNFYKDESWYIEKGLSYKIGTLLYGEPGTGKTSLIRALATLYNKNIYTLNLSRVNDESLMSAFSSVRENSFIVLEDFDTSKITNTRESKKQSLLDSDEMSPLTLAGLLNTLDGINTPQGSVIFFTTNHIEKIDPALLRAGRCDVKIELRKPTNKELIPYLQFLYNTKESITLNKEIVINPSNLEVLVKNNKNDLNKLLKEINDYI
jgi:energy-coupling factor transporter ATP-binding protein EcfA2